MAYTKRHADGHRVKEIIGRPLHPIEERLVRVTFCGRPLKDCEVVEPEALFEFDCKVCYTRTDRDRAHAARERVFAQTTEEA